MPTELRRSPRGPSRRTILGAGLGAGLAFGLSACGIRLEDDAPHIPFVPTRTPIPGESFLLGLLGSSATLERDARRLGGSPAGILSQLGALHAEQVKVLVAELDRLEVPRDLVDGARTGRTPATRPSSGTPSPQTASATASSSGSPREATTVPPANAAQLGGHELADTTPHAFDSAARTSQSARPLVGTLLAQRLAAGALLGARPEAIPASWHAPGLASSFLDSTRSAVYGMQVVAAQSPSGAQRTLARRTLATLTARQQIQEELAAASAGPPPLAYPLPFAVTTPEAARRLAVGLLTGLRAANARDVGSAAADAKPLRSAVGWLAETEVLASRWGVPLAAFPGLR